MGRRTSHFEVLELAPGRSNDGRALYVGESEVVARDVFEGHRPYGAIMLKNGRVVRQRHGKARPLIAPEDRLGYMQGRGAS